MENRSKITNATIAERLKQAEKELKSEIVPNIETLLFVNGRLDRKNHQYIAKNFSILSELNEEIKRYCKGIDLALLNYLIYKGLESIKKEDKFAFIEYSDLEKDVLKQKFEI